MPISILLAHPRSGSFCHALADRAKDRLAKLGHEVRMHDLYVEGFEPLVDAEELTHRITFDPLVERHCAEISRAEGIVIVHPNWWSQPPAILKGWIDRVLRPGVAYRFADDDVAQSKPIGALVARAVLVVNTSDMPRAVEEKVIGDPLATIWARGIFALCGVATTERFVCAPLKGSSDATRAAWLDDLGKTVQRLFPPTNRSGG